MAAPKINKEEMIAELERKIAKSEPEISWIAYDKVADDTASKYVGDLNICLLNGVFYSAFVATWALLEIPMLQRAVQVDPADPTNASEQDATFGGADPSAPISNNAATTLTILFASLAATLFATLIAALGKEWISYYTRVTSWDEGRQVKFTGLKKWGLHLVMASSFMLRLSYILFGVALAIYLWELSVYNSKVVLELETFWKVGIAGMILTVPVAIWNGFTFSVEHCYFSRLLLGMNVLGYLLY